jgi:hypothetical protein
VINYSQKETLKTIKELYNGNFRRMGIIDRVVELEIGNTMCQIKYI